jgi:hypothetical protein
VKLNKLTIYIKSKIMGTKNINDFIGEVENEEKKDNEKVVITTKDGLVERIDKKLVVEDGRELIREVTYGIL